MSVFNLKLHETKRLSTNFVLFEHVIETLIAINKIRTGRNFGDFYVCILLNRYGGKKTHFLIYLSYSFQSPRCGGLTIKLITLKTSVLPQCTEHETEKHNMKT